MTAVLSAQASSPPIQTATDYVEASAEERYAVISQRFPAWLLAEPIAFPRHHPTYGWACRVAGCDASMKPTYTSLLCEEHASRYLPVSQSMSVNEFARTAEPSPARVLGWALVRKTRCEICGDKREAQQRGYCTAHAQRLRAVLKRGVTESEWRQTTRPLPPFPSKCAIAQCVHDGEIGAHGEGSTYAPLCRSHHMHWRRCRLRSSGRLPDEDVWNRWFADACDGAAVHTADSRGEVSIVGLPVLLQREIRYALHRHANTARRTQWRPTDLQVVVNALSQAGVRSLSDPMVADLACAAANKAQRRIWLGLPGAARSLTVTSGTAKSAGWFDPVIVGGAAFPGTQGAEHRRAIWDLTAVSQRWLRDLLWDFLHDVALKPSGKRLCAATIHRRIYGIGLLSRLLRQVRADHGENLALLGRGDAQAVKQLWDLWFREQIPLPSRSRAFKDQGRPLTEHTRHDHMASIRIVLLHSREQGRTDPGMDQFIFGLPEYACPGKNPRPRPLSFGDFQLLVSADSLRALDEVDADNIGLSDIWLTQAFQGGRISETLKLRLGCVGLIGAAQPYIWRDITKVNVIDYGMPCHLPVYERLLRRQSITRTKLRNRYADQLAELDDQGTGGWKPDGIGPCRCFPAMSKIPTSPSKSHYHGSARSGPNGFRDWGFRGSPHIRPGQHWPPRCSTTGHRPRLCGNCSDIFPTKPSRTTPRYNDASMIRHLQQVWAAGPGTDKPGTILLRPVDSRRPTAPPQPPASISSVVPVEHGLCRYGPVVGGKSCPFKKNCTNGPQGPCEHFVLTGADLAYWERKRDAAFHFAEGAPNDEARDYILSQWHSWEPVLSGLRQALDELGLLEEAEKLDLRSPVHDYFNPVFTTGWTLTQPRFDQRHHQARTTDDTHRRYATSAAGRRGDRATSTPQQARMRATGAQSTDQTRPRPGFRSPSRTCASSPALARPSSTTTATQN